MGKRFGNAMYLMRQKVLTDCGFSENDVHDVIKDIKKAEETAYLKSYSSKDSHLKDQIELLEKEGRVMDIYSNMQGPDRIEPLMKHGHTELEAKGISAIMRFDEKELIAKYDKEGSIKEQRDVLIKEAATCLQELKAHTAVSYNIEERIDMLAGSNSSLMTFAKTAGLSEAAAEIFACNRYITDEVLAIPLDQDSPAFQAALTFDKCRKDLIMDGMPEMIVDTRVVGMAIEMEQAMTKSEVAEFADNIKNIKMPDMEYKQ